MVPTRHWRSWRCRSQRLSRTPWSEIGSGVDSLGWGGGKKNSTTIALSPLSTEETAHLISALLSQAVLPASTQRALIERAGGNPLYTEEFVRMLFDRGILERRGRVVHVAPGVEI